MKYLWMASALALLGFGYASRSPEPYRVVFDLTSRDTLHQRAVLRWIGEISGADPKAEEIEVVMYSKGFELVMPERSQFAAGVKEAMKNPHVKFKVCAIAMKNNGIEKSQLLPGVEIVPDGIQAIVARQQQHWGYIKAAL